MATSRNGNNSTIGVDFVGVLFAVVIGISATQISQKEWFAPGPSATFQPIFLFQILTLLLGYCTVIYSWLGYQTRIRDYPHKLDQTSGFLTFLVDILLLACYLLILVNFEDFERVLLLLMVVYWLYVLWDRLHWHQYHPLDDEMRRERALGRLGVSRLWAIVFTLTFIAYQQLDFGGGSPVVEDAMFLFLAYAFTLLYRNVHKNLQMRRVLYILTFQWLPSSSWLRRMVGT